jgi:ketol-acid reductoisomerase
MLLLGSGFYKLASMAMELSEKHGYFENIFSGLFSQSFLSEQQQQQQELEDEASNRNNVASDDAAQVCCCSK